MIKQATFPNHKIYETTLAGRTLKVNIGKMAGLANGSCVVSFGDTTVLVTATMAKQVYATVISTVNHMECIMLRSAKMAL